MRFQGAVLREQGQTFAVVVVQRHVIDNQSTATEEPIRIRMEQAGLTPRDLIPFVGSRAKVSELLSSRRPLTMQVARALHAGLGYPGRCTPSVARRRVVHRRGGIGMEALPTSSDGKTRLDTGSAKSSRSRRRSYARICLRIRDAW
jgi:hypothetical protein